MTAKVAKSANLTAEEVTRLVVVLKEKLNSIQRNTIEAGRILKKLQTGLPHGKFLTTLKQIGIAERTAYDHIEVFEQSERLPEPVKLALKTANLSIQKKPIRTAACEIVSLRPSISPLEVVREVQKREQARREKDAVQQELRNQPVKVFDNIKTIAPALSAGYSAHDAVDAVTHYVAELISNLSPQDRETMLSSLIRVLQDEMATGESSAA